ncbi:uncharacterized protein A4U43_C07F28110 [Asparagus officinalis]|uniref:Uncharacterized protein n=1 Tax=Asparagus officinalis TaxID=4686 RepID=A0A5P1EFK9_ASPOF|nr:uncharacterized protein LOC109850809 [Asparagus officinalis]ONK64624.1 uncharacterized protein A4U43_C07F28110 [Asparagus officinalis]
MATKWTDEKHRLYLDSIEASFVKQLYNSEYSSNDLLGSSSRTQIHRTSSCSESSNLKNQSFGQFKVLRRGCWGKLKSERADTRYENESQKLPAGPWIQHFKSNSAAREPHATSEDQMVEKNQVNQSNNSIYWRHGRKATTSKQPPPFFSQKVNKVSVGSITEVSDQNFAYMEDERAEELKKSCGAKRARNAASSVRDQVVPFVGPIPERTAGLKENNEE